MLAAAGVATLPHVLGRALDVIKQAQEWHLLDVTQQVGPVYVLKRGQRVWGMSDTVDQPPGLHPC